MSLEGGLMKSPELDVRGALTLSLDDQARLRRLRAEAPFIPERIFETFGELETELVHFPDHKLDVESPEVALALSRAEHRLAQLRLHILGLKNNFTDQRDRIQDHAEKCTDQMVGTLHRSLDQSLREREEQIVKRLSEEHHPLTGLKDAGGRFVGGLWRGAHGVRNAYRWSASRLTDGKKGGAKLDYEPLDMEKSQVEKIREQYLSEDTLQSLYDAAATKAGAEAASSWRALTEKLESELQQERWQLSFADASHDGEPEVVEDLATQLAKHGFLGTSLGTAVLAAGWHTLPWAFGHLFAPALAIVVVGSAITAYARHKHERDRAVKAERDNLGKQRNRVLEQIDIANRLAILKRNRQQAQALEDALFSAVFGQLMRQDLDWILATVEQHYYRVRRLRREVDEGSVVGGPSTEDLIRRARELADEGDGLGSMLFGAMAFEALLKTLDLHFGIGFDFRQQDHNFAFIQHLRNNGKINDPEAGNLHELRRLRNEIVHKTALLSMDSASNLTDRAKAYASELVRWLSKTPQAQLTDRWKGRDE